MKNGSDSSKNSRISVPKKIALAALGVLTVLTAVNLIQAAAHKLGAHTVTHDEYHVSDDDERIIVKAESRQYQMTAEGELVLEESFKVSEGENLSVAVGDADLSIETGQSNQATVEVYLEGRDMDRAREYFEDQNFEINQEGSTIYVTTHPERKNYGWNRNGGANITVKVAIPTTFNVNLKTSDGDIAMDKLEGDATLHTSDGDIAAKELHGPNISIRTSDGDIAATRLESERVTVATSDGDIVLREVHSSDISVRTSDGDIKADLLAGNASVATSDGDVFINTLEGEEFAVRTSDGEITTEEVIAATSQFQTSDGSIVLKSVAGELTAKTSSGDLHVTLETDEKVYLRTGDGDIHIRAPQDYSAELSLKGERVHVSSVFQFDGKIKENEATGRINGGGSSLEARTSDGEIVFKEN